MIPKKFKNQINSFSKELNIATFLILPLCRVNCLMFGEDNIMNVYLVKNSKNHYFCIVRIYSKEFANDPSYQDYRLHENYLFDFDVLDDNDMVEYTEIAYRIPHIYFNDCRMFEKGLYTKYNDTTKKIIYADSGLYYKKPVKHNSNTFHYTNPLLMALSGDDMRRRILEKRLNVSIPIGSELYDAPKEIEFMGVHPKSILEDF